MRAHCRPILHDPPIGRRRPALVMLVMLACCAGFWYNFENRFAAIEARHGVADPQGLFSPEEREKVLALRAMLRKDWGLAVQVRIGNAASAAPVDGKTMLINLLPKSDKAPVAHVILPPLVDKALASASDSEKGSFSSRLSANLAECAAEDTPGACVEEALVRLLVALGTERVDTPAFTPRKRLQNSVRAPMSSAGLPSASP